MHFGNREKFVEALRNSKMAQSPHAYVRGSTERFYEWLDGHPASIPEGPEVWICGDCHLGNLGALADLDGSVAIQIRDFDQTVIGNPAHDIIRLGLSLASAIRGSDLPGVTTARMLEQLVFGYASSAVADAAGQDRDQQPVEIRKLLRHSVRRRWRHLALDRFQSPKAALPRDKRFWPLRRKERSEVLAFCKQADLSQLVASRGGEKARKVADAAYWIKGCSSLGQLRYAVLLLGKRRQAALVDIKEASTAAAPSSRQARMPRRHADRVVAGAKALSPHLGDRMVSSTLLGKSVFAREVTPQDLKIEIDRLTSSETEAIARYLGGVLGIAHGRQMEASTWNAWRAELTSARQGDLNAPSWLWSSVVELLSVHELAYLEHCRLYAMQQQ